MRILYHHRIRSKDGQYVHLEEMVHALRAQGHQVEIVGPRHVETEEFGSDAGIVSVLKRWMPGPGYELAELAYSLADYRRLAAAIRRFRPDVIYERYNLYFPSGVWAKRRYNLPLLLEVNAPLFEERSRFGGIALPRLARWSEQVVWRGADVVLPVTQVLADRVSEAGVPAERIQVVPNGINAESFANLPSRSAAQQKLQLDGKLVLGFVGFMREWHGLERVLEFMASSPVRDRLFALFIGDGPARDGLEKRAAALGLSASMRVTGVIPRPELPAMLAAFDVALQPAVVPYASPLKLFEYLALGLPIIAPDTPNIREILSDGENAALFHDGNDESFRECLARVCTDPVLRGCIAEGARATIESQGLTWGRNAERVSALASALVEARAR
jgi:glycosyltransferase involved in cell wall biosynthesis